MAIWADAATGGVVQGLTGKEGQFHAARCREYGTKIVAGVTPGKGGAKVDGVPVFDTVAEARQKTGCNASLIFVPALAAADIGIAMGGAGTDVALETSDIAFLNDDLTKLPEVVALSRRTLAVIRQNIGFSVLLNLLSVLAAGLGWISPIGGAVIHESGAMAVILNAVRLLR